MTTDAAAAYSATGGARQQGPGCIYDRLAEVLVARCPVSLKGCRGLDVGAGTGAVTRAVLGVVAIDVALGMLAYDAARLAPAVVGDAVAPAFRQIDVRCGGGGVLPQPPGRGEVAATRRQHGGWRWPL